jgi:hypothetical protein
VGPTIVLTILGSLPSLNQVIPSSVFIEALNSSVAAKLALESSGPKTLFVPGDAAVEKFGGASALTDDIIKNHIFEGRLTADELLARSATEQPITSVSGEAYRVTHQVITNRERRGVLIRISNAKMTSLLTVLDIPSSQGRAHGIDTVFESGGEGGSGGSTGNSNSKSSVGGLEWVLIAIALVLVLFVVTVIVVLIRNRREPNVPAVNERAFVGDAQSVFYESVSQDVWIKQMTSADLGDSRTQHHFYPEAAFPSGNVSGKRGNAPKRDGKRNSKHAKGLSTPIHPTTRSSSERPIGYLDPEPRT